MFGNRTCIFWFRRDLRIDDNRGLYEALAKGFTVQCIFVFDTTILDKLSRAIDRRVCFIYDNVLRLKQELVALGSDLRVYHGPADSILPQAIEEYNAERVIANADFDAYSRKRDERIAETLSSKNVVFETFIDHLAFEPESVLKGDGKPYTVFTPYYRRWIERLNEKGLPYYGSENLLRNFARVDEKTLMLRLEELNFERIDYRLSNSQVDKTIIENYDKYRDFPGVDGTSRISTALRFGTVSIRKIMSLAQQLNQVYLKELIWREFYQAILYFFPRVEQHAFKPEYERIEWQNNEKDFERWCLGETGYPIVDAAMHQLTETGWMHNRTRMITASFLTKQLLIDWRWGEAWFAEHLSDFETASNNGGWQWASGSGCDAAPFFRIFNPLLQQQKFDPNGNYVKQWATNIKAQPMIDHTFARNRCIAVYKKSLYDNK